MMDFAGAAGPQSIIGPACSALITTVHQASAEVTNFVRRCRSARADLTPVTRELSELQMVLQLLDDHDVQDGAIPEELQSHLRPILSNCATVIRRIVGVLRNDHGEGLGTPRWTARERDEVCELSKSLGVHRGVMGFVSDLVAILVSRGSRSDRSGDGRADEQIQISEVLEELRTLGSSIVISYSNATLAREHFALQVHLGQIVTYTETLVRTELSEDAVKTLDEAQKSSLSSWAQSVQTSIPATAPLRRSSANKDTSIVRLPNKGLENLLPMGLPENSDHRRTPEPGGEAPATGFVIMDGFINSDPSNVMASPTQFGADDRRRNVLGVPKAESRPVSRRTFGHGNSAEKPITTAEVPPMTPASRNSQATRPPWPPAAGLEVAIPPEKEVATGRLTGEEITEEALAFAQVPVHVLGRLSVNLVGHVYPENRNGGSGKPILNHSLSTIRTDEAEEEASCNDAASTGTSNTGSLRDGDLQFSQLDTSKFPPPPTDPIPQPISQTPSTGGSQPQPSIESLFHCQSYPASQRTEDSTLPISSRPSHDTVSLLSNSQLKPGCQRTGRTRSPRDMPTMSTMNTETFRGQKPLPKAPIVCIPGYPGPFIKKKAVVVGNFSCGKSCLITRMSRGHFPRSKSDKCGIAETVKLSVDEEPMELTLWDIRGIDYDPTWLNNAHVALVCFSVNIGSTDSKGKHLGRWVAEVNRNCPGAAILLVGLKADMHFHARSVEKLRRSGKALVTPEQGEQFRENIGASRYLECSARTGEGVLEVLGETARLAMHIRNNENWKNRRRPLSRIGKFFGLSGGEGE